MIIWKDIRTRFTCNLRIAAEPLSQGGFTIAEPYITASGREETILTISDAHFFLSRHKKEIIDKLCEVLEFLI